MTGWRSPRGRPRGSPARRRRPALLRGSTTPCQYLLRMARSSGLRRASDPTSEPARVCGAQGAVAEEVAVQDGVLQHADLLGGGQRGLQLLVVAAGRGGRGPQVGEALQQDVEQRRRHVQLDLVPAQQLRRCGTGRSPPRCCLLVTTGIRTKLNRRLSAEDRSLTPRSRLLAVAMMEKPGLAKTMLSSSSSGMETYFSDRIEISASCTSLVERVSSSNRPITPLLHRRHDRRGDHRLPGLALGDDHGHVPRVLDVVLGGAGGALHDQRRVAADRRGQQLGQPALAGAGVADQQQAAVGGQRDDGCARRSCGRRTTSAGSRGPGRRRARSRGRTAGPSSGSAARRTAWGRRRSDSSQSSSSAYLTSAGARSISVMMGAFGRLGTARCGGGRRRAWAGLRPWDGFELPRPGALILDCLGCWLQGRGLLGEEVLEFDDELADVAGQHRGAQVLEPLAEPRVDDLAAGAGDRADRDELHAGAVQASMPSNSG